MTATPRAFVHRAARAVTYRMRWLGLNLFGPAQLGDANDPVEQLRRQYHRPEHHVDIPHPMGYQRSYDALPR